MAITTGALLLGGGALALMVKPPNLLGNDDKANAEDTITDAPALDVMPVADPNETFDQAFADARKELGAGGLFVWHGKVYHTFTKGEWVDLSLEQRQDFIASVGQTEQGEPLANVQPLGRAVASSGPEAGSVYTEATINGQRVLGVDYDRDGMVDDLIMQDSDGELYRVIDRQGDEGLDTVLAFDPFTGESIVLFELDEPFALSIESLDVAIHSPEVTESVQFAMEAEMVTDDATSDAYEPTGAVLPSPDDDNAGDEVEEELTVSPTEDPMNLDVPTEPVSGEDDDEELEDLTVYDDDDYEADTYAQNDDTDPDYGHQPPH